MEDSGYNSLMMGVYIFIFIIATSLTVYLFKTTVDFADKAYEYGKVTTGDSVIETTAAPKYNTVTGAELLTYYYNYKSPDKYGTTTTPNYDFRNIDNINISSTYRLIYDTANTGQRPVIIVEDVTSEEPLVPGGGVITENNQPTDPTLVPFPDIVGNVLPGTMIEFEAYSSVNYSFLTNYIVRYYWKIDYSPEDGRPDFVVTTTGRTGSLTQLQYGEALRFKDGVNTVYVTAEDALGKKSNTVSKIIEVGYNDPVINAIREVDGKVYDYGNIDVATPSGISLRFQVDAASRNPGGFIQKVEWYVDGALVQSGASERLNRDFVPGAYTIMAKVFDSIKGTAQKTFTFTVNPIPAPAITCSNSSVTNGSTIAIDTTTTNLTFNATSAAKYGIVRYDWIVDGTAYQTTAPNGLNLNYGIGTHTIQVYGTSSGGLRTQTATLTFTIKQNFVPFEQEYLSNGSYHTVTLQPGKYLFETWGAQGGNSTGGYGAYAKGEITLTAARTFYIYVGSSAGYNGGGISNYSYSTGGGATDIRTSNGSWNDITSLRSRIIVAAGGGGKGGSSINSAGGAGGTLTGLDGTRYCGAPGTGGTQTSGGLSPRPYGYGSTNGAFGVGGNGDRIASGTSGSSGGSSGTSSGAGGGGYYGGGGGMSDYPSWNDQDDSGGGGGSSFISGYPGCNAVDSSGNHTGQANHYSGLIFNNADMVAGRQAGDGKARITRLGDPNLIANITLSNDYFNGSTSYSQPGQLENTFTIKFDARPTTTTNMPTQGTYAYYSSGVKSYNYAVTDVHGGNLPVAGMGISVGTNGVVIIAHSDNYYYTLLDYPASLTVDHSYKVVVNNKIPSLYIDGTLVKTGVTPVNCGTLIARPSAGSGGYGNYIGYANNFRFYNAIR